MKYINEIEEILMSFEREFDRCSGNYKYNRKPVIDQLQALIDRAVKKERERIVKGVKEILDSEERTYKGTGYFNYYHFKERLILLSQLSDSED